MIMCVSSTGTLQRVHPAVEWRSRAAVGSSDPICRKLGRIISVMRTQTLSSGSRRLAMKTMPLPLRVASHCITGMSPKPSSDTPSAVALSTPSATILL